MKRRVRYWILAIACCLLIQLSPVAASSPDFLMLGQQQYEAGQYHDALQSWQNLARSSDPFEPNPAHSSRQFRTQPVRTQPVRTQQARARQVQALRYSAIAYKDLAQWEQAEQAIAQALALARDLEDPFVQAQVLNTQGSLQLQLGQARDAYESYQQAERIYRTLGDSTGSVLSQMNQVQALQSIGFYTRARRLLLDVQETLAHTPDQRLKIQQLRSLGSILQNVGELEQAQAVLHQALGLAQQHSDPETVAMVQFQLGNLAQLQQDWDSARQYYSAVDQHGAELNLKQNKRRFPLDQRIAAPFSLNRQPQARLEIESQVQQLRIAVTTLPKTAITPPMLAQVLAPATQLHDQFATLPSSRWAVDAQIHWAESLIQLQAHHPEAQESLHQASLDPARLVRQLTQALEQARQLQDKRSESSVLAQLGSLYEQQHQYRDALKFTQRALESITGLDSPDLAALWHWQAGRLLKQQGEQAAALPHYQSSVRLLQNLRQDLVAMTPDLQFSFREQVEPVYRQQVQLLLAGVDELPADEQQQRLEQSRQTIEALKLAELQNFFREACRTYESRSIDQIDPHAAVIYSLVLDGRLEVVLSLPNQPLQHYGTALSDSDAQDLLSQLRQSLNPAFPPEEGLMAAQRLYDSLIRPAEAALEEHQVKTLVFVLEDFLRNVPMAVLHDGDRYLVEKYNLALTPGLQLFESKRLNQRRTQLLAGGLSEARQGFTPLPGVQQELEALATQTQAQVLLNQNFARATLSQKLEDDPFSVLHLATHGQFSSRVEDTFLLAWDDRIGVQEFDQWLSQRDWKGNRRSPLELLTLSACQTAKGDDRATLGMAGMAVRSGARTTLATLWSVQDQSTSKLMQVFYQQLLEQDVGRAQALRQAQLQLLHGKYAHPYYWAPFVMVGNWQ